LRGRWVRRACRGGRDLAHYGGLYPVEQAGYRVDAISFVQGSVKLGTGLLGAAV